MTLFTEEKLSKKPQTLTEITGLAGTVCLCGILTVIFLNKEYEVFYLSINSEI